MDSLFAAIGKGAAFADSAQQDVVKTKLCEVHENTLRNVLIRHDPPGADEYAAVYRPGLEAMAAKKAEREARAQAKKLARLRKQARARVRMCPLKAMFVVTRVALRVCHRKTLAAIENGRFINRSFYIDNKKSPAARRWPPAGGWTCRARSGGWRRGRPKRRRRRRRRRRRFGARALEVSLKRACAGRPVRRFFVRESLQYVCSRY